MNDGFCSTSMIWSLRYLKISSVFISSILSESKQFAIDSPFKPWLRQREVGAQHHGRKALRRAAHRFGDGALHRRPGEPRASPGDRWGWGVGDGGWPKRCFSSKKETEIEEFNGIHDEFYTMLVCFCLSVLMCFFSGLLEYDWYVILFTLQYRRGMILEYYVTV